MNFATRIAVTVTFLRADRLPPGDAIFPAGCTLQRLERPTVDFYRYLYDTVGASYCWWLRRALPDTAIAGIIGDRAVGIYVLSSGGEPLGFFELDARARPDVNLSYFGLMPGAIGRGLGAQLLRAALEEAFAITARGVTVNTCTADHPRALPNYLRAGFRSVRGVRELWDIPNRLGMAIPEHLRV